MTSLHLLSASFCLMSLLNLMASLFVRQVSGSTDTRNIGEKMLPLEILERIVDHLHDDKDALRAICLTRKALVATCRLHLQPCSHVGLRSDNIHDFVLLLLTPPPDGLIPIEHFVSHLTLDADLVADHISSPLSSIEHRLSGVTHLSLFTGVDRTVQVVWETLSPADQGVLRSGFQNVEHLTVGRLLFTKLADMASFFRSFPRLSALIWVGAPPWIFPEEMVRAAVSSSSGPALPQLKRLTLIVRISHFLPSLTSNSGEIPRVSRHWTSGA